MDTPSTKETSVRVAINNNGSLTKQDTEVLIQPAACSLVRTITMAYVKADTLCGTGANVKVNTIEPASGSPYMG